MDLIYADKNRAELGEIMDYEMDLAYGSEENDFELTVGLNLSCCQPGYMVYFRDTEYGGIIDSICPDTKEDTVTYKGHTWHGILERKTIEPDAGYDYLYVSGDAHEVLRFLIKRFGLDNLFTVKDTVSGITIMQYRFPRYVCGYTGIQKMLLLHDAKLVMSYADRHVTLSVIHNYDYSQDEEWTADQFDFSIIKNYRPVNHLVCLGGGDLKERAVIHLFTDEYGNVQPYKFTEEPYRNEHYILDKRNQVLFGMDEVAEIYDYPNAERVENYVLLQDSSMIRSAEEGVQMLGFFRAEGKKSRKHITILDEKKIESLREREEAENLILSAIEEDRIEVFYQPIYATQSRTFTSAEALVRIRDKEGNIVPPGRFIPVAEQTGLISRIGDIVFEKVCAFIANNRLRERYGIHYVEVNLSVKQCEKRKLAQNYIEVMEKYHVDPSCINLEITESAPIQTRHIFLENVQKLIDYGVTFSLDDFGSGESNLNYIVEMPVSIVKFDRGMSQAYFADSKAKFVMEAAMHMIHDMRLKIVSEGVETKEQMETIIGLGIDYIQGFYFSKPLPEEEFLEFIGQKPGYSS